MSAIACSSYLDIQLDSIQEDNIYSQTPSFRSSAPRKGVKRIGNYILGKTIGSGTSSKVKIGTNITTGKKVAIKITRPKRVKERKEIEREISILKLLKHDNIIQLYDAIYEDDTGRICLILELVSGGELFDYIVARGRLSEKEGRKFFRQIVCGLMYCHNNMVCHRDLKLENLLVDDDGNIKISDFGYSNIVKPGNLMSTFCGSPVYAPPEILLEKKYIGTEVDVWSLGIILYAMVTGQLPWSLTDGVQVEGLDKLLRGEFKYPNNVILSNDVKDLINRMIVANPNERAKLSEVKSHPWINKGYDLDPEEEYTRKVLERNDSDSSISSGISKNGESSEMPTETSKSMVNSSVLYNSSPNIQAPKTICMKNNFSTSCLEDKKALNSTPTSPNTSSPQYSSYTPPLSPLSSSQRSPPTTPTFKTSLFHGLFKKKLNKEETSSFAGTSTPTSPSTNPSSSSGQSPVMEPISVSSSGTTSNNRGRRFSLEDIVKVITRSGKSKSKSDKLRSIKGPFTSGTTTTLHPTEVIKRLDGMLNSLSVAFTNTGYLFECKYLGGSEIINFEIEICRVSGMEMYGIKFRRLGGDVWVYSAICKQIIESLQL
ncbi:hypothetical protein CYY_001371 [Polysphondylium violaceum]|uniref:non-specific serine/threonine protein kinase n=1 Tax=Polysphondylium violaceum TaxID=133409 RepID=A0A8J4Q230_9MYCE|nr:hypothetical protein CYY_001371 [Polysphondylium violaceum]